VIAVTASKTDVCSLLVKLDKIHTLVVTDNNRLNHRTVGMDEVPQLVVVSSKQPYLNLWRVSLRKVKRPVSLTCLR